MAADRFDHRLSESSGRNIFHVALPSEMRLEVKCISRGDPSELPVPRGVIAANNNLVPGVFGQRETPA